jgi:hypothetical protein
MRCRFTSALAALLLAAAPVLAQPPKPAVVVQAKPLSRLLGEYREMIRQVGGPAEAERLVRQFDEELKSEFGEQGFEGIDINRPLAAYSVLGEKPEDASLVLVAPVTGEKEFVAFLERMKIKAEPVADKKGVYKLVLPDNIFPKDSHVIVSGAWAYVALNGGEPADPKNLVPPGELLDNADQSLVGAKVFPGRVPEKLLKNALDELDQVANAAKMFLAFGPPKHVAKMITTFLDEGPRLVRRYGETGLKEADEVALRFSWDQATGDTVTELTLVPKAGTPLAKEIAAKAATANRFANLVPKDAVVGGVVKAPLFAAEVREIVAAILEALQEELKDKDGLPEAFHPVADEVAKSLIGSVKKGSFDAAAALTGPNKDGKFTVVVGLSLDDAAAVEKALRQAAKAADLAKLVQFDVAKAGAVNVHKVSLITAFPEDVRAELTKVFGDDPPAHFAFDKDAVFVAAGPDSLAAVKAAVEAKPGAAPVIDVTANMNRLHKFIGTVADEKVAAAFAKALGTDDKAVTLFRVTVEGGQTLKAKATLNLRYIPKFFLVGEAIEATAKPTRPQVAK